MGEERQILNDLQNLWLEDLYQNNNGWANT